MNGLDKNLTELHMMLKTAEDSVKKSNSHVMMVQKSTSFKKKAKTWVKRKGKAKVSDGIQTNKPNPKTKSGPTQENECFYCKEPGHWKRNCKKYLADLKKNGGTKPSTSGINVIDVFIADSSVNSWVFDTGSVAHICNSMQSLTRIRNIARGEMDLRVGNKAKVAALAVGTLP